MSDMFSIKDFITDWNVPGWGVFLLLCVTLVRVWPNLQKNNLEARDKRETRYSARITELEDAVEECRKECDQHKEILRIELRKLELEMLGMRRQHIQEQISLVSAIYESVDSPVLKHLMTSLQSIQKALPVEQLGEAGVGFGGDAK